MLRNGDGVIPWTCDECGWPIDNNAGWLYLPSTVYRDVEAPAPDTAKVHWRVHHTLCIPERERCAAGYDIEIHRVRSWSHLVDWTCHLAEKMWFLSTDWAEIMCRRACGAERLGLFARLNEREREAWGRLEDIGFYLWEMNVTDPEDRTLENWSTYSRRFLHQHSIDA